VFEVSQQELVELCDVFEAAFDRPARFSFASHAERLTRILARFDRFTGSAGTARAGFAEAAAIIRASAEQARWDPRGDRVGSLAFFLPILDEASKDRRRHWRLHHAPSWGIVTGKIKGSGAKLGYDPKKMAAGLEQLRRQGQKRGTR
jgi:hypothetical protein